MRLAQTQVSLAFRHLETIAPCQLDIGVVEQQFADLGRAGENLG
jgi:hypothetical protein